MDVSRPWPMLIGPGHVQVRGHRVRPCYVAHIDPITRLPSVSKDARPAPFDEGTAEDRDDARLAVHVLAWPVDVAVPERHGREPMQAGVQLAIALGGVLALPVGASGLIGSSSGVGNTPASPYSPPPVEVFTTRVAPTLRPPRVPLSFPARSRWHRLLGSPPSGARRSVQPDETASSRAESKISATAPESRTSATSSVTPPTNPHHVTVRTRVGRRAPLKLAPLLIAQDHRCGDLCAISAKIRHRRYEPFKLAAYSEDDHIRVAGPHREGGTGPPEGRPW